jgi:hypothetical protein
MPATGARKEPAPCREPFRLQWKSLLHIFGADPLASPWSSSYDSVGDGRQA